MKSIRSESVRGTISGGVALGAVLAIGSLAFATGGAHAGGGCHEPVTTGEGPVVHIDGICFGPTIAHVKAGDTVTWTNDLSGATHTVTGVNGLFGSIEQIAAGESISHLFADEGTYPYYCSLHPGMAGAVVVTDGGGSDGESVSLTGRALLPTSSTAAPAKSNDKPIDDPWVYVPVAAAVAAAMAAAGFGLGQRRAKKE